MQRVRSRLPVSLYVAGPFAQGYTQLYNFLIPIYGLWLGMSGLQKRQQCAGSMAAH